MFTVQSPDEASRRRAHVLGKDRGIDIDSYSDLMADPAIMDDDGYTIHTERLLA